MIASTLVEAPQQFIIQLPMLKTVLRPLPNLQIKKLHLSITIRTFTMAALQKSWLSIPADSHFSLANIPFGIITSKHSQVEKRPAIAIGDYVLDLKAFAEGNGFSSLPSLKDYLSVFSQPTLNAFAALGRPVHLEVRAYLQDIFSESTSYPNVLKSNTSLQQAALLPKHETKTHLPMQIGDYTDFFAGINHAFNVGTMFRGPANALQPNYTHLPVGYHGRASSVVISGTPIRRPNGQILLDPTADPKVPTFAPCRRLDIELELGCFLCKGNTLGEPIRIKDAEEHVFGYVLMNDWSARDIQTWEYVPLGPFNAKNFGTSISAWVVLADALQPFRAPKLENKTEILPYLKEDRDDTVFDIKLEVDLTTPGPEGSTTTISKTSGANLLWSFPQMIAHHSVGGCAMQAGDLLGSGTISGKGDGDLGSMLEMNQAGKKEIMLAGMDVRKFLKDGDTVTLRGVCGEPGALVGFGECVGTIESAVVFN
jgi:fumarylacetoacetase